MTKEQTSPSTTTKSYKVEVTTAGDNGVYTSNALRFATREKAEQYGFDLACRWTAVVDVQVVECDDPVDEGRYA